jgi:hypothetical protein
MDMVCGSLIKTVLGTDLLECCYWGMFKSWCDCSGMPRRNSGLYSCHSISLRHMLIFHSHLLLCFPRALFPPDIHANTVCLSILLHTHHVLCPAHFPSFGHHPNNIWWEVHIITLFIMKISSVSLYLHPLTPKYLPQHPVLEQSRPIFLL